MRIRVKSQQSFFINVFKQPAIVQQVHEKYNRIDQILQENPEILTAVHKDLKSYGDSSSKKRSAFSTEQILRMLIVKCIERLSFRGLIIRVNESDFLRNFTLIGMGKIMSYGFVNGASKCIDEATWNKINQILLETAIKNGNISADKLRVDSTVCASNIHYPTDSSLLWDSYRVLCRLMHQAVQCDVKSQCGYRFHERKIKALHTFISTSGGRKNKSTKRKVTSTMRVLIERVEDISQKAESFISSARQISTLSNSCLELCNQIDLMIQKVSVVTDQARRSQIEKITVPASERIFSIFEDHTELLMRGNVQRPIEFGHLVTLAQTAEKFITYYKVEEKSKHDTEYLEDVIESHKKQFEKYPDVFTADKNYYKGMDDVMAWEEKIPVFSIAKKGNRTQDEIDREHSDEFRAAQSFRAGCEGSISVLKRAYGLYKCFSRGFKSFSSSIGCLIFCHNIVRMSLA
jgi:transposase, IS5 family